MLQADFLLDILQKCQAAGIHTAVDTAGFIPWSQFAKIMPYTDLFLYDIKLFDPQKHRQYIGAGNELILENLRKLFSTGTKIWIRIPVVPGINDSSEEMQAIRHFLDLCGRPEKVTPPPEFP